MSTTKTSFEIRDIPFIALGGVFDQSDVDAAIGIMNAATSATGNFFPLPEEQQFQDAFARHEGAGHAVAVNSCGTALDLCMMALGIKPGDEVITTPLTFICTATCAIARAAKVVFADIEHDSMCLDPADVRRRITPRTRAIIPVHFAGHAADVAGFEAITRDSGVPVIYDAAHAVSTKFNGRPIGGAGLASCYSFQSNKNMTTLGEGGAITTNDGGFAEQVRQRKTFGFVYGAKLAAPTIGFNYRMTKVQCAVGLTQLAKIDQVIARRRAVFDQMNRLLSGVEEVIRPSGVGPDHGCHLYVARLDRQRVTFGRDRFLGILKSKYRVSCANHYPPVWSWKALADLGYSAEQANCPIAAKSCEEVFSLPLFPHTAADDVEYVAWAIKQSLRDAAAAES